MFRLLQISGDLESLQAVLGKKSGKKVVGSGSCSALVKLFDKNLDLAISQVTWNDFNSMIRIYKLYNFTFHEPVKGIILFMFIIRKPLTKYWGSTYYIWQKEVNTNIVQYSVLTEIFISRICCFTFFFFLFYNGFHLVSYINSVVIRKADKLVV